MPTSLTRFLTDYSDQSDEPTETPSIELPENLSELSTDDVTSLHEQAVDAFSQLYDSDLSDSDLETLSELADIIDTLNSEKQSRDQAQADRVEQASELATRIGIVTEDDDPEITTEAVDNSGDEESGETEQAAAETDQDEEEVDTVAASGRKTVDLSALKSRSRVPDKKPAPAKTLRDYTFAAQGVPGTQAGENMDVADMAQAVDRQLGSYNHSMFQAARNSGKRMRQQHNLAVINKPFHENQIINSDSYSDAARTIDNVVNERNLPHGSLVAAGGWCAPSETMYDLVELESSDGLLSLPEVSVNRGGIRHTLGPRFSTIYNDPDASFSYTEQEDIDGDYDGEGGGAKPCYRVQCPDFEEVRLNTTGLCISAGLLQQRGYPEMIARTIRGALIAHEHHMSARLIGQIEDESDAVSMPADQVGATAPVLTALELQIEHMRYVDRLPRSTTVEAVAPYWVRAAIRADLARRLGVDMIDVNDARVDAWFASRGANVQYVYDWQELTGDPADMTAFPDEVKFLLYPAGTWVRGSSPVIDLQTIYDSELLGQNDYTALFTEEGWLLLQRGWESRAVTVPICPSGGTHSGLEIVCDGTAAA